MGRLLKCDYILFLSLFLIQSCSQAKFYKGEYVHSFKGNYNEKFIILSDSILIFERNVSMIYENQKYNFYLKKGTIFDFEFYMQNENIINSEVEAPKNVYLKNSKTIIWNGKKYKLR